jgi:hypothetical protein
MASALKLDGSARHAPCRSFSSDASIVKSLIEISSAKKAVIFERLSSLADAIKHVSNVKPLVASRLNFISAKLREVSLSKDLVEVMACVSLLKSSLQIEASMYGSLEPMIKKYQFICSQKELKGLKANFFDILKSINLKAFHDDGYHVDIKIYREILESKGISSIQDGVFVSILKLLKGSNLDGDFLIIPLSKMPSKDCLKNLISDSSQNEYVKLLAQILYLTQLSRDVTKMYDSDERIEGLFLKSLSLLETVRNSKNFLLSVLQKEFSQAKFPLEMFHYLSEKEESSKPLLSVPFCPLEVEITPCLHYLENSVLSKSFRKDAPDQVFSGNFLSSLSDSYDPNWLEDSAEVFDLLCKIEGVFNKKFSKREWEITKEACSMICSDEYTDIVLMGLSRLFEVPEYPVRKDKIFCENKIEFLLLPFARFSHHLDVKRTALDFMLKEAEEEDAKKVACKKKGKKQKEKVQEACLNPLIGTSLGEGASVAAAEETALPRASLEGLSCSTVLTSSPIDRLLSSYRESYRTFRENYLLHPRVLVWQKSSSAGLLYWKERGEYRPIDVTDEELILHHRLPRQVLFLAFDPHFSFEGRRKIEKSRLLYLLIDNNKYLIELSLNERSQVYHFMARPCRNFTSIFKDNEIDPIKIHDELEDTEGWVTMDSKDVVFDPDSFDVHLQQDGHRYVVKFLGFET